MKATKECIIICACSSYDHQAIFWHDEEFGDDQLYVYFHLTTYKGFFKRLWVGIRYAFGHTSRFGEWDQFIFDNESEKTLKNYLDEKSIIRSGT